MGFIRSLNSILAQRIRHHFPELTEIFSLRPYTRILSWGKDFKNALRYQVLNQMEALGLISRKKKASKAAPDKKKSSQSVSRNKKSFKSISRSKRTAQAVSSSCFI